MASVDGTIAAEPCSPRLPAELEREIFEWAGWSDDASAYSLIRVAKRVHKWIEPLLYWVLSLSTSDKRREHSSSLISRFHRFKGLDRADFRTVQRQCSYVRHFLHLTAYYDLEILSLCTSAVDCAAWNIDDHFNDSTLPTLFSNLRLRKFSISVVSFESHPSLSTIFHHTVLANTLTHVEIYEADQEFWKEGWKVFKNIPLLTHIALQGHPDNATITVQLLLDEIPQLLLVIDLDESNEHPSSTTDNPRFIALDYPGLSVECWLNGTSRGTGFDFWAMADELQQKKREKLALKDTKDTK